VQFKKPSHGLRLLAPLDLFFSYAKTTLTLASFCCVLLLAGCAGTVTSTSNGAFSISGSITPAADGNGATVTLSGPTTASATASNSGNFNFSGLTNGNYALTPSRNGYMFTPGVQSVAVDGSSVSGVAFAAAVLSTHTVLLKWNASSSSVSGYNVYRGTSSGGPYSRVTGGLVSGVSYTDSSLAASTTYYYVTTSVTSEGVESGYSNQASAKIP
jgi:hypothetical protein